MSSNQPVAPSPQQSTPVSIQKSLLNSNFSKNGESMSNCKNNQTFLTLLYLLDQCSKLNSSTNKDNNSQQRQSASNDSINPSNTIQPDSLSISRLSNIKEVSRSLFFQIQQNDQSHKTKNIKPKPAKKDKKPKEAKGTKSTKKSADVNRLKFTRSKSQPNPSFFVKTEGLLTQKKICIPNWKYINEKYTDIADSNDNDGQVPNAKFDVQMHKRLEIYENRIINGLTKYHHPAYSVQLENDESSTEFSPTEIEEQKLENYESVIPQQKIPLFWEPRSWDTEESHMAENDSHELQLRIENEESEESIFNLIKYSPKYKYNKKYALYSYSSSSSSSQSSSSALSPIDSPYNSFSSGNMRKKKKESNQINRDRERRRFGWTSSDIAYRKKSTEVEISNLYYETDESCDETDIELF